MKLIGACMVMAGCMGLAQCRIGKDKKRRLLLGNLQKLFVMLHSEIQFRNLTITEAFFQISRRIDPQLAAFLTEIGEEWKQKRGESVGDIWKACVRRHFSESYLKKEDLAWLEEIGEGLGSFDRTEQVRHIELLLKYLEDELTACEGTVRESEKLYKTMGLLGGIFIIVLLF